MLSTIISSSVIKSLWEMKRKLRDEQITLRLLIRYYFNFSRRQKIYDKKMKRERKCEDEKN